jgi:hypothetical protein
MPEAGRVTPNMFAEIRMYAGFAGQAGRLAAVRHELEKLVRDVPGLRRFQLLETVEGFATVTEADDRGACEECARRAERWMGERIPALAGYQPLTASGAPIAEFGTLRV